VINLITRWKKICRLGRSLKSCSFRASRLCFCDVYMICICLPFSFYWWLPCRLKARNNCIELKDIPLCLRVLVRCQQCPFRGLIILKMHIILKDKQFIHEYAFPYAKALYKTLIRIRWLIKWYVILNTSFNTTFTVFLSKKVPGV